MTAPRRIIIVGGGIGGWTTASALRTRGYEGEVVIVESEPACYDRPPLSKTVLSDGAPLGDIAFTDAAGLERLRIEVRTGRSAVDLDASSRRVQLDDGSAESGDVVVLATGASPRPPDFPGGQLPGVRTLRTYADAMALRALAGRRVAVVGAGLIGAEAAAALRQAGSAVVLIDPSAVPGEHVFGPTLAAHLHALHTAAGVDTRVDAVASVTASDGALRVLLHSGAHVEVDGVLVGTGIRVQAALAESAGLAVDQGIVVDVAGRTSAPGVFAVGDTTRRRTAGGLAPVCGHWDAARVDGETVAATILGQDAVPRGADWFWSDRYGHHIEVVGELGSGGEEIVRPGAHPTVFRVTGGLLTGAGSVDDPMTVRAARRLIERRVPVTVAQLADPGIPLRSLIPKAAPAVTSS